MSSSFLAGKHQRCFKYTRLLRFPHPSSLNVRPKYASLLGISGALHPGIFEQPESVIPDFEIAYPRDTRVLDGLVEEAGPGGVVPAPVK
jgi:hypothetical protein